MSKQNITHIPHLYLWVLTDGHLFTHYSGISSHSQGSLNMANSKQTSFNNTISSTLLSFITVLFEDLFEAVNIQAVLVGEKVNPKLSIKLPKKN